MRTPRQEQVYRAALIHHAGGLIISISRFFLVGLPAAYALRRCSGRSVVVSGGAILTILGALLLLAAGTWLRGTAAKRTGRQNRT